MEKIAIPTLGDAGLKDQMSPRFGRCPYFTLISLDNGDITEVKVIPNSAAGAMGGAGIQAAQLLGNNGATAIVAGFLGPNAYSSLAALNLPIYQVPQQNLTVKQVVQLFMDEKLQKLDNSNVGAHYGMGGSGGGGGMGRGGGMGGGMGGGGGGGGGRRF